MDNQENSSQGVPCNNMRWSDIDCKNIEKKIIPMWEMVESLMDSRPLTETLQGRITI